MPPTVLFPANTLNPRAADTSFEAECSAAKAAGFEVAFVGLEAFFGETPSFRGLGETPGEVIYRGWMLKEDDYRRLETAISDRGKKLITSTEQYLYAYHFPNWYKDLDGMTPRSATFANDLGFELVLKSNILLPTMVFNQLGPGPFILKDWVKSRKHEWFDACFIPGGCALRSAEDIAFEKDAVWNANLMRVVRNFVERQGEFLVGGLVFREFIELKRIGVHSKSRLPLVNEHRFFAVDGEVIYQAPYWGEGDYSGNKPLPEVVEDALWKLKAPFLAIDVAESEAGDWVVIEVNDGGTAGIPEGGDAVAFYDALRAVYP